MRGGINRTNVWCLQCDQLEHQCSICGVPVPNDAFKTAAGKYICRRDLPNAVLTAREASAIFEDTRRDLVDLFGREFALRNPEVSIKLFEANHWEDQTAGHFNRAIRFGCSRSLPLGDGQFTHSVELLNGRLRLELISVCAHEYTHLWINENKSRQRKLDEDTVEAICELSAYKLAAANGRQEEQEKILSNAYTRGKISDLIECEKRRDMRYIMNWVRDGTSSTIEEAGVREEPEPPPPTFLSVPVPPPLRAGLVLNGVLMGETPRGIAMINGEIFAANDIKSVRLQDKTVRVNCRKIHAAAVEITVDDQPVTLNFSQPVRFP